LISLESKAYSFHPDTAKKQEIIRYG